MAKVRWLGTAPIVPQVDTVTVSSAAAATAYFGTHSSGDVVTVPAISAGQTVDTVAALIVAALQAYGGVFSELTAVASGAGGIFTVTGPSDGLPFTITWTSSPGGAISSSTTTSPKSNLDASNVLNYSTGALPSNGDTLIFENSSNSVESGLTALAGIALAKVEKKSTYTGRWGLPDVSSRGYNEFRATEFQLNTAITYIEATQSDAAGQYRIKFVTTGSAISINASAANPPTLGNEPYWIQGMVATSTIAIVGSGVWVCPRLTDTGTVSSIVGYNSSVRIGEAPTVTTVLLQNCNGDMGVGCTTFTLDRSGTFRLYGAGAYTTVNCQGGTIYYQSSGTITTLNIGSGAAFDASLAASAFTVTTCNLQGDGWTVKDPIRRINLGTNFVLTATDLSNGTLDLGTGGTFAFSA